MDDKRQDEQENIEEVIKEENTSNSVSEPDFKDKYTRLLAEFTNYQKQKEQEVRSMAAFGNSKLLTKILDIVDDIEMGLSQDTVSEETKSILNLLKEKLSHLLNFEGVKEIDLKPGDSFDANQSEAIHAVEDEKNSGKIIQVARKGYMLADRVLRTAKVVVGK